MADITNQQILAKLEEHDVTNQQVMAKLEEHDVTNQQIMTKLEEHDVTNQQLMTKLESMDVKLNKLDGIDDVVHKITTDMITKDELRQELKRFAEKKDVGVLSRRLSGVKKNLAKAGN